MYIRMKEKRNEIGRFRVMRTAWGFIHFRWFPFCSVLNSNPLLIF